MKNYKTTIIGLITGGALAAQNYDGHGGWKGYVVAIAMALLGILAKDFNH